MMSHLVNSRTAFLLLLVLRYNSTIMIASAMTFKPDSAKLQMDMGPHPEIRKAHLIYMTHFDVGYTVPTVDEILDLYITEFFPAAFNTSKVLRELGGPERFKWTSHAWLLDNLLRNQSLATEEFRANLIEAIERDDITWHANPMNMQPEVGSARHISFGQGLAHSLDDQFHKTRKMSASQKDVPGTTLGIIPIMARHGVNFIHIGVNDMSTPPAFPHSSPPSQGLCNVGYWQFNGPSSTHFDKSPEKILISYCSGYNAPVTNTIVSGFDESLVFLMKIDNRGPHSAEDVIEVWKTTQSIFPNAELVVSSMDSWYEALQTRLQLQDGEQVNIHIPTIEDVEFGDTWVYGTSSDPTKMRWYRAVMREIDSIFERLEKPKYVLSDNSASSFLRREGEETSTHRQAMETQELFCNTSSPDFIQFYTTLLKIPEHTWGHNGDPCRMNFTNGEWLDPSYECMKYGDSYQTIRGSWIDQRNFVPRAINQLDDVIHGKLKHHLKMVIKQREPVPLQVVKEFIQQNQKQLVYNKIDTIEDLVFNYSSDKGKIFEMRFNASGAIDKLKIDNTTFCVPGLESPDGKDHALGVLTYRTHSEEELNEFGNEYCEGDCSFDCGRCGFAKCNMDCQYSHGKEYCNLSRSSYNIATVKHSWKRRINETTEEVVFMSDFENTDPLVRDEYGPPKTVFTKVLIDMSNLVERSELLLHYDLTWYDKPETRMAESIWLSFAPYTGDLPSSDGWRMHKLGYWIDPMNVAINGSRAIHNIWDGIRLMGPDSQSFSVFSPDAPVVSPNLDLNPTGAYSSTARPNDGWGFSLFNNAWNTNYPLWSLEKEERFQFTVSLRASS